jgi:hypothetical protein
VDGLILRGRLVKVIEPRSYVKRNGEEGTSYPGLVILAGEETVKVEYRTVEARDDAVLLSGAKGGELIVTEDGMVPGLPEVEVACRALGQWDSETRSFAPVRFAGV